MALVACEGDKDAIVTTPDAPVLSVSEVIPTVATVSWTTSEPSYGYVEFGMDGEFDQATPMTEEATTEHSVVVYGLKAGGTYDLRAVSVDASEETTVSEAVSVTLDLPPAELPGLTISEHDEAATAPGGFVLATLIQPDQSWVVIIDRDGDIVWYWEVEAGLSVPGAHFDVSTHSVTFMQVDVLGLSDVAQIYRVSLDGTEVTTTRALMGHHEALRHEDGTMSWLSFDFRTVEYGGEMIEIVGDRILEIPEGSTDEDYAETVFSILDKTLPYAHCEHFYDEVFNTRALDFSHFNSLVYDKDRDVYMAMSRNLDTFLIIDRKTGEVLTHIGGDYADIATADSADMWSHAHMTQAWDGGFMVFDNGVHYDPMRSRVVEYALDVDEGTLELVWEWTDPDDLFNPIFGDAQKLGDTYMTSWTTLGRLQEVSAEGEVVWRAETDIGTAMGRAVWIADLYDIKDPFSF